LIEGIVANIDTPLPPADAAPEVIEVA
jgi:hypothetical protein